MCNIYLPIIYVLIFDLINFGRLELVFLPLCDPGKAKIITRRGCKHPERILDSSKSSVSVMFAGTASGYLLPPYVVYKAEKLYDSWTVGGPKGTRYNRSKSGWFDGVLFEDWFNKLILPYYITCCN
jgi:hypothetical protein